jgi:hypothetical protein
MADRPPRVFLLTRDNSETQPYSQWSIEPVILDCVGLMVNVIDRNNAFQMCSWAE